MSGQGSLCPRGPSAREAVREGARQARPWGEYRASGTIRPVAKRGGGHPGAVNRARASSEGYRLVHNDPRRLLSPNHKGVVSGVVLSFAHTLGEFGVVLMVGGNLPGITRTVSIAIYDDVQGMEFAAANKTALTLLLFSFLALAAVYALIRKPWSLAPQP
jgi:hypothetical protein